MPPAPRPTESSSRRRSAQRAAHRLARRGRAMLARVKVPTRQGLKGRHPARRRGPDLGTVEMPGEAALRVIATRGIAPETGQGGASNG